MKPADLLEKIIDLVKKWFKNSHEKYMFFTERDVVYSLQSYLKEEINKNNLPYMVFNDWPILPGKGKRHICADLILNNVSSCNLQQCNDNCAEIAFEFKYEPDRKRKFDFHPNKLKSAVVSWKNIEEDEKRVKKFVENNKTKIGCSIFIDEGGRFYKKYKKGKKNNPTLLIYKCEMVSGKIKDELFEI